MARGRKGTGGAKIQPTVPPEIGDVALGFVQTMSLAAGEALSTNGVHARALMAGYIELAKCPACYTGSARCERHTPEAMIGELSVLRLDQTIKLQRLAQDGREHQALIDYFWIKWEQAEGQRPIFAAGDGPAFRSLRIGAGGLEQAKRIIDRAFELERDGRWRTIQAIAKNPSKYTTGRRGGTSTLQREPDFMP